MMKNCGVVSQNEGGAFHTLSIHLSSREEHKALATLPDSSGRGWGRGRVARTPLGPPDESGGSLDPPRSPDKSGGGRYLLPSLTRREGAGGGVVVVLRSLFGGGLAAYLPSHRK